MMVSMTDRAADSMTERSACDPLSADDAVGYLEAWRRMLRPLPGSVPPLAGFDPIDPHDHSDPVVVDHAGVDSGAVELGGVDHAGAVAHAVQEAVLAVGGLAAIDPSVLDAQALTGLIEGVEQLRRMIESGAATVAGHVDGRNPFREQGYFNAKTFLKQRVQLSGVEAHRRVRTARMLTCLPEWASVAGRGGVGVAQVELMGCVAANPRIEPEVLQRDAGMLLDDAMVLPFVEFERNLRTWEALADPAGDDARNERQHAARDLSLRPRPDGGWSITGFLPEPSGAEFAEIFAWFVDAEWRTDWADARSRFGDLATQADLARTEAQRRADALLAMALAAANGATGTRPGPTMNVLIDQDTMEAHVAGLVPDSRRFRNVVCRTQSGRRLHPDDAVNMALIDHIRRVVYDQSGTVIDLGRRSRLFRGSARDAVMLLLTTCVWVGCDRPVAWCDADHSLSWRAHGATVPRNGGPLCKGHDLLKERGFQVFRDDSGHWHIIDPSGNEVT